MISGSVVTGIHEKLKSTFDLKYILKYIRFEGMQKNDTYVLTCLAESLANTLRSSGHTFHICMKMYDVENRVSLGDVTYRQEMIVSINARSVFCCSLFN